MTLRLQTLKRRALLASLLLAACGQPQTSPTAEANTTAPVGSTAAGLDTPARPDLPPETKLAFVHTANVMGELEPCG